MSSYLVNAGAFAIPGEPFLSFGTWSGATDQIIAGELSGPPSTILIQGVDLVDHDLVEGHDAWIYLTEPVTAAMAIILRGFVYASSQGVFTWRGSLPIIEGQQLKISTLVGTWHYAVWGIVVPSVSNTP